MLQGTFETLSLVEVLDLLGAARKTGGFHVVAGRDTGALWIEDGACVAVQHDGARGPVSDEVGVLQRLVQLGATMACHPDGAFRFVTDEEPPWRADLPAPLREALGEIDRHVARWDEVRKVVPSLDVTARLSPDLQVEQLYIDRERWQVIAGIGAGRSVRDLAEKAEDQLALCQAVAALVEAGAVQVSAPEIARPVGRSMLAESPYGPGVDESLPDAIVTTLARGA